MSTSRIVRRGIASGAELASVTESRELIFERLSGASEWERNLTRIGARSRIADRRQYDCNICEMYSIPVQSRRHQQHPLAVSLARSRKVRGGRYGERQEPVHLHGKKVRRFASRLEAPPCSVKFPSPGGSNQHRRACHRVRMPPQNRTRNEAPVDGATSAAPSPHQYFTFLYYLFPCNVIRFLRWPVKYFQEGGLESPYTVEWEDALDEDQIKSKSEVRVVTSLCPRFAC